MKKFSRFMTILFCMFLPIMFLSGCKNTPTEPQTDYEKIYADFVPVYSIFYQDVSVSGILSAERLYSTATLTLSSVEEIDESEYNTFNLKFESDSHWTPTQVLSMSKTKTILGKQLDAFKEGDFIGFYNELYTPHYYKREILSYEINYIYVKILSENTFLIKNNDGIQFVSTQNFNIEFFD